VCLLARTYHFPQKLQHASCRRRPTLATYRGIAPHSFRVSTKQRTATPSNCWQMQEFISGNSCFILTEQVVIYCTHFSGKQIVIVRLHSHHFQDYAIAGGRRSIWHARSQLLDCCFLTIQARQTRLADSLAVGNPCIQDDVFERSMSL
jgi:hypothetical protein